MRPVKIVKQISVIIDNAPGTLARIAGALAAAGINVVGFAAWGESDHGVVRIVCDKPLKALDLLEEAGMIALSHDVLEVARENRPGALEKLAARLAKSRVNINYAFGSTPMRGHGVMYLGVSSSARAMKALARS